MIGHDNITFKPHTRIMKRDTGQVLFRNFSDPGPSMRQTKQAFSIVGTNRYKVIIAAGIIKVR